MEVRRKCWTSVDHRSDYPNLTCRALQVSCNRLWLQIHRHVARAPPAAHATYSKFHLEWKQRGDVPTSCGSTSTLWLDGLSSRAREGGRSPPGLNRWLQRPRSGGCCGTTIEVGDGGSQARADAVAGASRSSLRKRGASSGMRSPRGSCRVRPRGRWAWRRPWVSGGSGTLAG